MNNIIVKEKYLKKIVNIRKGKFLVFDLAKKYNL